MELRHRLSSYMLPLFVGLVYFILYSPIIVLVVFSFNKNPLSFKWYGFTLDWYKDLFSSVEILEALKNSIIVALSSVFLSIIMAVLYVFYGVSSFLNRLILLFYGSLITPEIVLAVGLLSIFTIFSIPLGLTTLIVGHTLVGLAYVVPIIRSHFQDMDYRLIEASMDLGATETQTFFKIVIPILFPAIISAALLVLIVSLDDFLIAFFCSGASTLTLPMYIFAEIRSGATPIVNALSTLLLVVSSLLILILTSLKLRTRVF